MNLDERKLNSQVSARAFKLMEALDDISDIPVKIDQNSRYLML